MQSQGNHQTAEHLAHPDGLPLGAFAAMHSWCLEASIKLC
jgi:hypothetical protein